MLLYKSLYFCYLSKEAGLIVDTFVSARTNSNPNINFKLLYMKQSMKSKGFERRLLLIMWGLFLSLKHISAPTRLRRISYDVIS